MRLDLFDCESCQKPDGLIQENKLSLDIWHTYINLKKLGHNIPITQAVELQGGTFQDLEKVLTIERIYKAKNGGQKRA